MNEVFFPSSGPGNISLHRLQPCHEREIAPLRKRAAFGWWYLSCAGGITTQDDLIYYVHWG